MSRLRATVVATRDSRVLLVMDRGRRRYSLPGGGVKKGEPSIAAAARELYEETGLNCSKIGWQFSYRGRVQRHRVFCATPVGEPPLKDGELSDTYGGTGNSTSRSKRTLQTFSDEWAGSI